MNTQETTTVNLYTHWTTDACITPFYNYLVELKQHTHSNKIPTPIQITVRRVKLDKQDSTIIFLKYAMPLSIFAPTSDNH